MTCVFTADVKYERATITVRSFDESYGKWVYFQQAIPLEGVGYLESNFSVPLAEAAAIGAALIAAAKAAGWVEAVETVQEVETVAQDHADVRTCRKRYAETLA